MQASPLVIISSSPVPLTYASRTHPHFTHKQVQLQLLEAQSRIDAASRELNDAQRLQTLLLPPPPRPPSSAPANHPGGAGAEGGAEEGPRTALEEEVKWEKEI